MRVKDPSAEPRSWTIIMKEQKVLERKHLNLSYLLFTYYLST